MSSHSVSPEGEPASSSTHQETIVAISTPPGRGGIGIVRLSGPQARSIAEALLRLRNPLAHAQARFAEVLDEGRRVDDAVVTLFAGPHSYTGEDVIEIAAHGSPVILDWLVRRALGEGARLAQPGEFTERAFQSGRIDLTQAEAVRDLIDAQTLYQARLAAEQMGGALSHRTAPIKQELIALIALVEAGIDFAEDDVDLTPDAEIALRIEALESALAPLVASFAQGRIVHSGITLAIVGRPNAGKSSLFNRLVERERAIVTAVPGTTRDLVTETVSLGGIPLHLVDTAGLRDTQDEAESIGIAKTRTAMAEADVILLVLDVTGSGDAARRLSAEEAALVNELSGRTAIAVLNKIDLAPSAAASLQQSLGGALPCVATSAISGEGIPELRSMILKVLQLTSADAASGLLTNLRHYEAVSACIASLARARVATTSHTPHEMLLLDLYAALRELDSLTGQTTADDILNRIFSTFCIGK